MVADRNHALRPRQSPTRGNRRDLVRQLSQPGRARHRSAASAGQSGTAAFPQRLRARSSAPLALNRKSHPPFPNRGWKPACVRTPVATRRPPLLFVTARSRRLARTICGVLVAFSRLRRTRRKTVPNDPVQVREKKVGDSGGMLLLRPTVRETIAPDPFA